MGRGKHYFEYFQGVTASGLGHLLGNESMPNNAYTKNTEDDFLDYLFCGRVIICFCLRLIFIL